MNADWTSLLIQIAGAVGAFVVSIIGIVGAFYVKRLDNKLKMKTLNDEIRQMLSISQNSKTFKAMAKQEQVSTILGEMEQFALENGINISEQRLIAMIENAMNFPLNLERKLLQLKESHYDKSGE